MEGIPTENFLKRYQHLILAALSAVLLFLSFPNLNLFPCAWIAMVPFFIALTRATDRKSAFWIGYLMGFLFFAGLLLAILLLYPYANIFATLLGYLLLVGYTAVYFAVFAMLMQFVPRRSGVLFTIAAACIWTALEWVRSWLLTGFPLGKHRLLAMEQSAGNTDCLSRRCSRHQFHYCAFQCKYRCPDLQPSPMATGNSCRHSAANPDPLLLQLRDLPTQGC